MQTIRLLRLMIALSLMASGNAYAASTCEGLAALALSHAKVTHAEAWPGGTFTLPEGTPAAAGQLGNLPPFCRVTATLTPSADSEIRIEVWLPASNWNGKLQSVGNGAWGGAISYGALGAAMSSGYATAATDTGHVGNNATFAVGHPEKLADYGYRAVHEMTVAAKTIVSSYYGRPPTRSYWNSCSTGGREGLMEAQRFPNDYDGIIAGAPVHARTQQLIWQLWVAQAVHHDDASYIPPAKYPVIHRAALEACDARDGVTDGLIENPVACRFDPAVLRCSGPESASCLTDAQVEAARKIYAPVVNSRTGQAIYPGMAIGSELGWGALAGPRPTNEAMGLFRDLVFANEQWDFRSLRFDEAEALASRVEHGVVNALDDNLKPFFDRGGKLLLYHGWSDQLVAPLSSVDYYERVLKTVGEKRANNSIRLFMIPGMTHCQGGEGPDTFDKVGVMEAWVERTQTPNRIVASHRANGSIDRTRPLCPYPQVAAYKGAGSIDDAANFVCKLP